MTFWLKCLAGPLKIFKFPARPALVEPVVPEGPLGCSGGMVMLTGALTRDWAWGKDGSPMPFFEGVGCLGVRGLAMVNGVRSLAVAQLAAAS